MRLLCVLAIALLMTQPLRAEVRTGMRVEAVWKPKDQWGFGIDNIEYFRPTGEPDADYDTYKDRM